MMTYARTISRRQVNFEIIEDSADVLLIRDLGPWDRFWTVTNGAEIVVAELASRLGGRRLEYFDSAGDRDEILVLDGRFAGFRPGSPDRKIACASKPLPGQQLAFTLHTVPCRRCGRLLTGRASVRRGFGTFCWSRRRESLPLFDRESSAEKTE
jgi:hypothetical protein